MYSGPKAFFYALSRSRRLKQLASRYGLATDESFAHRFIAGETIEEAITAARRLQAGGFLLTLDYLGESVRSVSESTAAAREYVRLLDVIASAGIERNLSLKLTQLGLDVDKATCVDNLRRIMDPAGRHGFFVRIDMERSIYTDVALEVFDTLWGLGHRNLGVALQACLRRTDADAQRMTALGVRVRLVKGAYKEPAAVAYQHKTEVDASFRRLTELLLDRGNYPAIATHDPALIEQARTYAVAHGIAQDRFEFQMLYGVRRDLQASLVQAGCRMRVYVPFGHEWFPYFMRRLGERPANVGFVLRSLVREGSR